jgi:hypothetical protein
LAVVNLFCKLSNQRFFRNEIEVRNVRQFGVWTFSHSMQTSFSFM